MLPLSHIAAAVRRRNYYGDDVDYYIDSNAAPGGDGTASAPYDDFSELQSFYTGDNTALNGKTVSVARGSRIDGGGGSILSITNGLQDFTLKAHGTGDDPIYENKTTIAPGAFTEQASGHWTVSSVNGAGIGMSLVIDGVWFHQAALQADAADTTQTNKWWLDDSVSPEVIHVYSTEVDPTAASSIETSTGGNVFLFQSANGNYIERVSLSNMDVRHGTNGVMVSAGSTDLSMTDVSGKWTFDPAGSSTSIPLYFPNSRADTNRSTGLTMTRCTTKECDDQNMALREYDGAVFTDCVWDATYNSAIEYNGSGSINLRFNRCKFTRMAMGVEGFAHRFAGSSGSEYTNIKMINCLFWSPWRNYQKALQSGTKMGATAIRVNSEPSNVSVKLVNCTFFTENQPHIWVHPAGGTVDIRYRNCILASYDRDGGGFDGGTRGFLYDGAQSDASTFAGTSSTWGDDMDTNRNVYFHYNGTSPATSVDFQLATPHTLADWQAESQAPDQNSVEADPLFVEINEDNSNSTPYNLALQAGSPAIGLGRFTDEGGATDPDVPLVDIDGNPRDPNETGTLSAGCYEFPAT